jgi:hypothetical protein
VSETLGAEERVGKGDIVVVGLVARALRILTTAHWRLNRWLLDSAGVVRQELDVPDRMITKDEIDKIFAYLSQVRRRAFAE